MFTVEAVYQGGVFKPIGEVKLAEDQRVKVRIEPVTDQPRPQASFPDWIERVRAHHREFLERHGGPLPDSTPLIAEDRCRDV